MKHVGTIPFETKRLICRPFKQKDSSDMLKNWIADPKVQFEYGEPVYTTLKDINTLLTTYIHNYNHPNFYRWAIIEKSTQQNIGQIAFCRVYSNCQTAEIEYCIGQSFWGQGFAGEALLGLIQHTFSNTNFIKLEAYHRTENIKSGKTLKNSIMQRTDTVERFKREKTSPDGKVCYHIIKQ